jgi:hypothetical protein
MYDNLFSELKPIRRADSSKRSRSRQGMKRTEMRRQIASQVLMEPTRQPAPSWRMRCTDMSRKSFIGLMAGWTSALVVVLFISAFIRSAG